MHGLAGALAQPLQVRLGNVHDLHAVDDAAGQLKHFQGQPVTAGTWFLRCITQADQACQQPVHGAFGKVGLLCQPLQTGPGRVRCQLFDQLEDALHALYAAFFGQMGFLP